MGVISYPQADVGVISYSQKWEVKSVIAPRRLFQAMILDSHNVLPESIPKSIKSTEFIEGDGGVGSIMKINFSESFPMKYTKHRINALDLDNFYCKYTMIESNFKFDKIISIVNEVQLTETDNGCICKTTTKYNFKQGAELGLDDPNEGKDILLELFKAVVGYLVECPDLSA